MSLGILSRLVSMSFLLFGSLALHGGQREDTVSSFQAPDGTAHTIAELRGHPAVINFWATWCVPCKDEMPRLQKLAAAYQPRNVRFVAISLDAPETRSKIGEVTGRRGFTLPVWVGATEQTLTQLQLGELLPATLILDGDGIVIGKIEGEARDKDIRSRLEWLLNGREGKQPKILQKNDW